MVINVLKVALRLSDKISDILISYQTLFLKNFFKKKGCFWIFIFVKNYNRNCNATGN